MKKGFTSTYIKDHGFTHVCDIPSDQAIRWAKDSLPEMSISYNSNIKLKNVDINDKDIWYNKLFIVVDETKDYFIALYRHDDNYSIRIKKK